jgi:hypothetical protein
MCTSEQTHAVFSPCRVAMHLSCHQLPLQAAESQIQLRMNEIRHLKSHSVRIELREVTAHLQETGRWQRQVYGEPDTDSVMQPVAYRNYIVLLVISMIDGKG